MEGPWGEWKANTGRVRMVRGALNFQARQASFDEALEAKRSGNTTSWPLKKKQKTRPTTLWNDILRRRRSCRVLPIIIVCGLTVLATYSLLLESLPILRINTPATTATATATCPPRLLRFGSAKRPVYRIPYCAIRYGWMKKKDSIQ